MAKKIIAVAGATGACAYGMLERGAEFIGKTVGVAGADDLGNMFQFKAGFQELYCGNRPIALSRSLLPKLQSFAQWLEVNQDRIPLG